MDVFHTNLTNQCHSYNQFGESAEGVLVKVQWPFANGESPLGENLIGEERVSQKNLKKSVAIIVLFS